MKKMFHYLVRAVIVQEDHVLLAKAKGSSNTFLPGGHVEIGETMHQALSREIKEEIGQDITIKQYLGVIEHKWIENEVENFEINHIFLARLNAPRSRVISKEEHLELGFHSLSDLNKVNLKPDPLVPLLSNRIEEKDFPWFASTL